MPQLLYKETSDWKRVSFVSELYVYDDGAQSLAPVTQVQAVPFTEDGKIVVYKHIDGYYGLPGGKVEAGENLEAALARELREEMNAELIQVKPVAYIKSFKLSDPDHVSYNLRYAAKVKLSDGQIQDPAGKAIERLTCDAKDVNNLLRWGKRGDILIDLALRAFK